MATTATTERTEPQTIAIQASGDFVEWLDRLAASQRLSRSAIVDRSIVAFAAMAGFHEPAPKRTNGRA